MTDLPIFLVQHELTAEADERAIKRAYAKSLKQIDQENDLAGFQALRESYEEALEWLQSRSNATVSDPVKPQAASDDESPVDEPGRSAEQQSASSHRASDIDVTAIAEQLLDELWAGLRKPGQLEDPAENCLLQALDDARLIHMETRLAFELLIARYLAQGWRHGNGELFDAAVRQFAWKKDRRRLLSMGSAGYAIDRALIELNIFHTQPANLQQQQWEMLRRARIDPYPDKDYLRVNIAAMNQVIDMCPYWVTMVSNKANIEEWFAKYSRSQEVEEAYVPLAEKPYFKTKMWLGLFGIFLVLSIIGGLMGREKTSPTPTPVFLTEQGTEKISTPVDENTGVKALRPIDEKLGANDLERLGNDYFFGKGYLQQSFTEAMRYWTRASEKGSAEASYQLASMYDIGKGVHKDIDAANKWYEKAAEQGDPKSQILMGNYYAGSKNEKDFSRAAYFYEMAATNGDVQAQLKLATMYEQGQGIKKDPEKIASLIQAAADSKNPEAEARLGSFYLLGSNGMEKNEQKAAYWLYRSASQKNVQGQRLLGHIYEHGLASFPVDLNEASKWYAKAAQQGDHEAQIKLSYICSQARFSGCWR
ncbi:tetratricopeptide repeat protein [Undibacterium sp. TJN19]|uniref:tetratricopeptide repeat protein n=1 Tax=Undibacterium sp. TJN19 TaxID=3413055 RepID=UPI003BF32B51